MMMMMIGRYQVGIIRRPTVVVVDGFAGIVVVRYHVRIIVEVATRNVGSESLVGSAVVFVVFAAAHESLSFHLFVRLGFDWTLERTRAGRLYVTCHHRVRRLRRHVLATWNDIRSNEVLRGGSYRSNWNVRLLRSRSPSAVVGDR